MRKLQEPLKGCLLLEGAIFHDDRGYFRRLSTVDATAFLGMSVSFRQCAASFNLRRGTVRGLHFQAAPHLEHKMVQCLRGAIFDVMVDLRPDSPTYGQHFGTELSEANGRILYSVPGFAHGFQTLSDDCLIIYHISPDFVAGDDGAVRWDDPDLAIAWPLEAVSLSAKDERAPLLRQHDTALTTPRP